MSLPLTNQMAGRLLSLWLLALSIALCAPGPAAAAFGFAPGNGLAVSMTNEDGSAASLAGSHPYELSLSVDFQTSGGFTTGDLRDLQIELPPGVLITPTVRECTLSEFHADRVSPYQESLSGESCPLASQVGVVAIRSSHGGGTTRWFGVFNLAHPQGAPAALGFSPYGTPVVGTVGVEEPRGALTLDFRDVPQAFDLTGFTLTLWGTPSATPTQNGWTFWHDDERGNCLNEEDPGAPFGVAAQPVPFTPPPPSFVAGTCSVPNGDPRSSYTPPSYLSLPTACGGPLVWRAVATSWQGGQAAAETVSEAAGNPVTIAGCVDARSVAEVELFTEEAAAPTGLKFNIHSPDATPTAAALRLTSPPRAATMSLPDGLTINPSLGAGLGYCTEAQLAGETLNSGLGEGCPNNAKIGTVALDGLLGLGQPAIKGSVYLAQPFANQYGSLIALYVVIRDSRRGILFKPVGKVLPDPHTGRLEVTFENLPQLQYSRFTLTLREGQRSTMVAPTRCGTYIGQLELSPYSDPAARVHNLSFLEITEGEHGGPCPTGSVSPFSPRLDAGSLNPFAGAYTPFLLRMSRADSDQEITSYSASFPPGLLGKIAGIPYCPDAAIEAAKARTGVSELESPSCPAASAIGRTLSGYGVGGTLAYAPGNLYLSGPYHGSPLSITAIDSAIVGPFDLGVVVVRSAIRLDPNSAQVSIDSAGSDPIPHILNGIPIHLRDIRVYVDRPDFTVNPTSCNQLQTHSLLTGAGGDVYSPVDDSTATSVDRYQLLGCSDLGFEPRFRMTLRGRGRRGGFPSLRAEYQPRPRDANIVSARVALPRSEFLAQRHLRDVCTLRQFDAGACPPRSVYGSARVFTPLLAEPMEGPVYLRSSKKNPLPDLVVSLRGLGGLVVNLVARIDTGKGGGMRATFENLPDAPVTKFVLTLQGGSKGLLENSTNVCRRKAFASALFVSHANAGSNFPVRLRTICRQGKGKGKGKGRK